MVQLWFPAFGIMSWIVDYLLGKNRKKAKGDNFNQLEKLCFRTEMNYYLYGELQKTIKIQKLFFKEGFLSEIIFIGIFKLCKVTESLAIIFKRGLIWKKTLSLWGLAIFFVFSLVNESIYFNIFRMKHSRGFSLRNSFQFFLFLYCTATENHFKRGNRNKLGIFWKILVEHKGLIYH